MMPTAATRIGGMFRRIGPVVITFLAAGMNRSWMDQCSGLNIKTCLVSINIPVVGAFPVYGFDFMNGPTALRITTADLKSISASKYMK
jgi:hypothetical protein